MKSGLESPFGGGGSGVMQPVQAFINNRMAHKNNMLVENRKHANAMEQIAHYTQANTEHANLQHGHAMQLQDSMIAATAKQARKQRGHEGYLQQAQFGENQNQRAHEATMFSARAAHNEGVMSGLQSAMVTKPEHGQTYLTGATYHPENGFNLTASAPHMAKSEDQIRRSERSKVAAKNRKKP